MTQLSERFIIAQNLNDMSMIKRKMYDMVFHVLLLLKLLLALFTYIIQLLAINNFLIMIFMVHV